MRTPAQTDAPETPFPALKGKSKKTKKKGKGKTDDHRAKWEILHLKSYPELVCLACIRV